MENYKFIVANENKLGYVIGKPSENNTGVRFVVTAVDYVAGGDPLLIGRTTYALKKDIRPANEQDKQRFNFMFS